MESKVSENVTQIMFKERTLAISHTLLPISQSTSKMQNTKSTTGVICKANDDIFHVIFVLCKNQNSLYVKQNIFSTGKKYVKRI